MNTLLEVQRLTKIFNGVKVLDNISLRVYEGEIVAVIGPNGAGKTTLINCISGFCKPDSGSVFFLKRDITNLPPYERCKMGICRTFQIPKPFPSLTVFENVMVAKIANDGDNSASAVSKILKFLGMSNLSNRIAESLTLVEKKKLELARALATHPKLLLLDEIGTGLFPSKIREFSKIIGEINKKGITILLADHVIKLLENLKVKRVIALHQGKKIAEGKLSEIMRNKEIATLYLG
jgi:branched-chain amino acid transport system ATP-binding protein